mmetsp:Transcript_24014/g.56484  ORF Transcript_24014/g.56484 Transcript_24014/m.56484 type:complete len:84 (+) Transcript_24014:58-309(+)
MDTYLFNIAVTLERDAFAFANKTVNSYRFLSPRQQPLPIRTPQNFGNVPPVVVSLGSWAWYSAAAAIMVPHIVVPEKMEEDAD